LVKVLAAIHYDKESSHITGQEQVHVLVHNEDFIHMEAIIDKFLELLLILKGFAAVMNCCST
jgi:hypothetical protein